MSDPIRLAPDQVLEALAAGRPLSGVELGPVVLDGRTFERPVVMTDCVVAGFDAREAVFAAGLDLSGCRLTGPIEIGSGHSAALGRFAGPARIEGDLRLADGRLAAGAQLDGCRVAGVVDGAGVEVAGQLDLSGIEVGGDLRLDAARLDILTVKDARVEGRLVLAEAVVAREANAVGLAIGSFTEAAGARFEGDLHLGESRFVDEVSLVGAVFAGAVGFDATHFEVGVEFGGARFLGPVDFHGTGFGGWADLGGASFAGPVALDGAVFERGADLQDAVFEGPVEIRDARFSGETYFRRARFAGRFDLVLTRFLGRVDLREIEVGGDFRLDEVAFVHGVHLSGASLAGRVTWERVDLGGDLHAPGLACAGAVLLRGVAMHAGVDWSGARLAGPVELSRSWIDGRLDLRRARFEARLDLVDCHLAGQIRLDELVAGDLRVEREQVRRHLEAEGAGDWATAAAEWEFLKQSFESRHLYNDVDFAYYKTRQMNRRSASRGAGRIPRLFELLFVEWGTGYGTRPINVLVLSLVAILVFALAYANLPGAIVFEGSELEGTASAPSLLDYVYFSFVTFTTMGFGDTHPSHFSWMKYVVALEAFAGLFLMALFVSTLTRKIIRQ